MPVCGHCGAAVLSSQRTCPMCTREVNPAGRDLLVSEQRKPKSRTTKNYGASVPDLDRYAYAGGSGVSAVEPFGNSRQARESGKVRLKSSERHNRNGIVDKLSSPRPASSKPPKAKVVVVSLKGQKACFQITWNDGSPCLLRSKEFPSALLRSMEGETTVASIHADFLGLLKSNGWQVTKLGESRFAVTVVKGLANIEAANTRQGSSSQSVQGLQAGTKKQVSSDTKSVAANLPSKASSIANSPVGRKAVTTALVTVKLYRVNAESFCFSLFRNGVCFGPKSTQFLQKHLVTEKGKLHVERIRKKFVSTLTSRGWVVIGGGDQPFETVLAAPTPRKVQ